MGKPITVLGAGSVGVGTAMHLQQRGWDVTLIDRKTAASETSYGNAGVVNASSFIPFNNPGLYKKLPGMLLNNKSYLRYNLAHVLKNLPWVFHFLKQGSHSSATKTAEALSQLSSHALDEHKALMQRVGNMSRLSESGWLKVFRTGSGFDRNSFDAKLYERYDIGVQEVTPAEISDLEPSLSPIFNAGFMLTGSTSVNNPGALIREYADQFVADGGKLVYQDVRTVHRTADDAFQLSTADGVLEAEHLVITAGPWSGDLLSNLGYRVLLGFERGYHQHYHFAEGAYLNRPVQDVESGFFILPMEQGARITTGVELNHRDAPSNYSQLEQVLPKVREMIRLGEPTDDPIWRGTRPTFPDSRPVIDQAPAHKNLWMAFGHQHIGLMTGPITGKLLAQKISDEKPELDLEPFRASRWITPR